MLSKSLEQQLNYYENHHLLRHRYTIQRKNDTEVIIDGKSYLNFCSNDYLALAYHPDVKKAFIQSVRAHGLGSGASPIVSGYTHAHAALEDIGAAFLNRERALLFNSGYHANLAVLTALTTRKSLIVADKHCHASLIDGMRLSPAKHYRYPHQDFSHAESYLKKNKDRDVLLVSESVYSMEGRITDVKALAALATRYHATLVIDDAHGIGVLGQQGKGIAEYARLSEEDAPCLIVPFGKAVGSMGAIVAGKEKLIEVLLQSARTYRYSTALPPAICDATSTAIKLLEKESWRREKLNSLIRFFIQEAQARGWTLISSDETPIKSIVIGSNQAALSLHHRLMQQGIFVSCIRPPTVPIHTARLRISINCMHREEHVKQLFDAMEKRNS